MGRKNVYRRFRSELQAIKDDSVVDYIKRPSFQMSGNKEFFAEGIISIEIYTQENISFFASKLKVNVSGRELTMCFYNRNTIKISGYITGIEFE